MNNLFNRRVQRTLEDQLKQLSSIRNQKNLPLWAQWFGMAGGIASFILAMLVINNKQKVEKMEDLLKKQDSQIQQLIDLKKGQQAELMHIAGILEATNETSRKVSDQITATKNQTSYIVLSTKPQISIFNAQLIPYTNNEHRYILTIKNYGGREAVRIESTFYFLTYYNDSNTIIQSKPANASSNDFLKPNETTDLNVYVPADILEYLKSAYTVIILSFEDILTKKIETQRFYFKNDFTKDKALLIHKLPPTEEKRIESLLTSYLRNRKNIKR